jgi:Flp pilus assembly protein TadG
MRFFRSDSGTIAVAAALLAVPLLISIGMVVDYSMATTRRAEMQSALDAAAFGALTMPDTTTMSDRQKMLQGLYAANGGLGTAELDGDILSNTLGASMKVTSRYDMPTAFMGIIGQRVLTLAAASSVSKPVKLKSASFKLDGVTGAWDKTVTMMGRLTPTSPYLPLLQMAYTTVNIGGWGTTILSTPNPKSKNVLKWLDFQRIDCTALRSCVTKNLSGDGTAAVDISAMDDVYLQMDISAKVGKVYWWFDTPVVTLKSNDPNTSDQMFVEGKAMAKGSIVNMVQAIGCNEQWVEQRWEDGGGHEGVTAWEGTDFRYEVKGGCTSSGGAVRLTN